MNPVLKKFNDRAELANSLLCVGLDVDFKKLPQTYKDLKFPQFEFGKWIIDQTAEYAAAFKANSAFYEARGARGTEELEMTADYLRRTHSDIVSICDAKRGDIGNTNRGYAAAIFDEMGFDAVTLHPYLGEEALSPFLERRDKMCIVLCRTSNSGAGEFQDLESRGKPLWQIVAERVSHVWNEHGNCMLVVGATYPQEMQKIRRLAPEMTFLVPGIGAQKGDVADVVSAGLDAHGKGMMISVSRAILFSENPAAAAQGFRDEINRARMANHAAD